MPQTSQVFETTKGHMNTYTQHNLAMRCQQETELGIDYIRIPRNDREAHTQLENTINRGDNMNWTSGTFKALDELSAEVRAFRESNQDLVTLGVEGTEEDIYDEGEGIPAYAPTEHEERLEEWNKSR